jgi:hypothetical protein
MNQANVAFVESTTRPDNNGASGPTEADERSTSWAQFLHGSSYYTKLLGGWLILVALCFLILLLYIGGKIPVPESAVYIFFGIFGAINIMLGVIVLGYINKK